MNFFKSISIKHRLHQNITTLSFIANGVFNFPTSKLVTDLHETECEKRQRKRVQRLDDRPDYTSKNSSWKIPKNSVNKKSEIKPQLSKNIEPSSSLTDNKCQLYLTEAENFVTLSCIYLLNRNCQLQVPLWTVTRKKNNLWPNSLPLPHKQMLKLLMAHNHPTSVSYITFNS